jgi:hypothetical protein
MPQRERSDGAKGAAHVNSGNEHITEPSPTVHIECH